MSLVQQQFQKSIKEIEIVLSTRASVSFKNGSLKFQLRQADFQSVERLLWRVTFLDAVMKGLSNTWNAAICQSYEKKLSE